MADSEEIIADNIRRLRISKGWTQSELADAADVSLRSIQAIENEGQIPRAINLGKIASALKVPVDRLYKDQNSKDTDLKMSKSDLISSIVISIVSLNEEDLRFVDFVIKRLPLLGGANLSSIEARLRNLLGSDYKKKA